MHDGAPQRVRDGPVRGVREERAAAAVVRRRGEVHADVVLDALLDPVDLEVGEELVAELGEEREGGGVAVDGLEVAVVVVGRAVAVPRAEERVVLRVGRVEGDEGERGGEVRDVAAIDDGARGGLGRADGGGEAGVVALISEVCFLEGQRWELPVSGGGLGQPDRARAEGRAGALPEGAAEEEVVGGCGGGVGFHEQADPAQLVANFGGFVALEADLEAVRLGV